nr:hypothetical protein CFP56_48318 [Quercus suber]
MDSLKNKQAAKNRQEEIKKVVALRAQGFSGSSTRPKARKVAADAPRNRIGKGLMISQGLITPPPLPLLVKDKEYAMDTTYSIVQDADMDECSEHKTDPLGDSSLHDMMRGLMRMRALQIHCASREALIKHLKDHLGFEVDALKKFKESSRTLSQEIKLSAPMTFAAKPILNDEETDEEVLVTDTPGGVADDLMNPQE